MKRCLNSPQQSKNTASLKRTANLSNTQSINKQCRPPNILQLWEDRCRNCPCSWRRNLKPFGVPLGESCLYNLSSGQALPADKADDINKCYSKGLELMKTFTRRLLENGEQKFHDSITRNPVKSFKSHVCSKVIAMNNKTAKTRANQDITGFFYFHSLPRITNPLTGKMHYYTHCH